MKIRLRKIILWSIAGIATVALVAMSPLFLLNLPIAWNKVIVAEVYYAWLAAAHCSSGIRVSVTVRRDEYAELRSTVQKFVLMGERLNTASAPQMQRYSAADPFGFLNTDPWDFSAVHSVTGSSNELRNEVPVTYFYYEISEFKSRSDWSVTFKKLQPLEALLHQKWPDAHVERTCWWGRLRR